MRDFSKNILNAMYPADPRNSISMVFSRLTCFSHIDYRANLATGFLIAYTYNIRNKVLQSLWHPDKTHFNELKDFFYLV